MTSYTYDSRDRLIEVEHPDGSMLSYAYDSAGNRTSVTAPNGTTTFSYDQLNRLAAVIGPDSGQTTYTYDNVGNRASVTYPNGTYAQYTYDALNRLTKLENKKADGSTISRYNYTLGPAGNRVAVSEYTGRTVNYTYDELYRLITEEILDPNDGDQTITYTYDSFGNRLTKTDNSGTTTYTYDDNDRLLTENSPVGLTTYTYDNNGNTIRKDSPTEAVDYTYDFENRLTNTSTLSDNIDCAYDADGIRVSKNVNGQNIDYVVDKNRQYAQVLEEYENGSLTTEYIHGDDLISQTRGANTSYYHYDGQLSTRQLSDASSDVTDKYKYDAFGILIDHDGSTENNYLYTGEQYDPNVGFYYLRARYYDQGVGRFVTRDAYPGRMYESVTIHRYLYSGNNPVMNVDPSGKTFSLVEMSAVNSIRIVLTDIQINMGIVVLDNGLSIRDKQNSGALDNNYYSSELKAALVDITLGISIPTTGRIAQFLINKYFNIVKIQKGLYRKSKNAYHFSSLSEPMQLRHVKKVAKEAGIGLKNIKVKIIRDPEFIGKKWCGYAFPDAKTIYLFPDAFSSRETLVRTIAHERMHCYQYKTFGKNKVQYDYRKMEMAAHEIEDSFWDFYNR